MISSIDKNSKIVNFSGYNTTVSNGVSGEFSNSIFETVTRLKEVSPVISAAMSDFSNIIILENAESFLPEEYFKTSQKLNNYATEAYGFVSKDDDALVIIQQNHNNRNLDLEGDICSQAADTFAHEVGHYIDDEFSTSDDYKKAYLADLKHISSMISDSDKKVCGEDLSASIYYLKHYLTGVNFEDGISEEDITRTGLRENFAECFSTLVDENPSKINEIYAELFPNTMSKTAEFIF